MAKPYILAVDDDPEVLGTLSRALTRDGFEVGRATSGLEALRMLAARRPDLIILDIIMPGLDGLTVCRRIRADNRYNDLAILFLTARGQTDDVVAGLDVGGDDYVVKPFELAELTARVRALVRRGQRFPVHLAARRERHRRQRDVRGRHHVLRQALAEMAADAVHGEDLRGRRHHGLRLRRGGDRAAALGRPRARVPAA